MRKLFLLALMVFLTGTTLSWAEPAPGTLPDLQTDPKFGDHGAGVPCPPGSQGNSGDSFGDKGGMQNQDQTSPRGRHAVPPVNPDTGAITPQSKQGDSLDQPSNQPSRPDQLGKTDCQPGSSDRGAGSLDPGPSAPSQPNEPPVLLPPAGTTK
jgi:hypothetical protein